MKKLILISILLIVGCDNILNEENSDESSQFIFIYLNHSNSYWDNDIDETIYNYNTNASGWLDCDPFCEFNYLKLDTIEFKGDHYSAFDLGYKYFPNEDNSMRILSHFSSIDVELSTSLGTVSGLINLPDTIMTLGLSTTSSLPLSSPFTISWSGSNADFYRVSLDYSYTDYNENSQYKEFNEYTSDNSFTFPDTTFIYNGQINWINVQPINGSIPENGSKGNMSANGFLYYSTKTSYYDSDNGNVIIVGSGTSGRVSSDINKNIRQDQTIILRDYLIKKLYLNNN